MSKEKLIKSLEERAFKLRITRGELCKMAGVSVDAISRWKNTDRNPSVRIVKKLEAALDAAERKA